MTWQWRQGIETSTGALAVNTGEYTGLSSGSIYCKDSITEDQVGGESKYSWAKSFWSIVQKK
jgi:ATP-dependent phosphoenolpyruvate carboxykinase